MLSTCNRVEVYADVAHVPRRRRRRCRALLAERAGVPRRRARPRTSTSTTRTRAVQHLFHVACGLDSMVVGEEQILGQVRAALRVGAGRRTVGRALNELVQQALRVGKRAHAETGIDRAGRSLVDGRARRSPPRSLGALAGRAGRWSSAPAR